MRVTPQYNTRELQHPDEHDLDLFDLQNELRMWKLLWWELQDIRDRTDVYHAKVYKRPRRAKSNT